MSTRQKKSKRRGSRRATLSTIGRSPAANSMVYTTRWEYGQLQTGTTGLISASDIAPSITNSSEYSTVASLFSEVKLLSCNVMFTPHHVPADSSGRLWIGTQMQANQTVQAATPLVSSQVTNLTNSVIINVGPGMTRVYNYRMKVPRRLMFASISADAPDPVTPYAGSPGAVYVWGDNLTASVAYVLVDVQCTYILRGRV